MCANFRNKNLKTNDRYKRSDYNTFSISIHKIYGSFIAFQCIDYKKNRVNRVMFNEQNKKPDTAYYYLYECVEVMFRKSKCK